MTKMSMHVKDNRKAWDEESVYYQEIHATDLECDEIYWAEALSAETDINLLGHVKGRSILELGCGACQASIALATRGAAVVGIDISINQLRAGQKMQFLYGVSFPLVLCDAESELPFSSAMFDVVISVFGAIGFIQCEICFKEVYRVLRPGGLFVFSWYHPFFYCFPQKGENQIHVARSYFDRSPIIEEKITSDGKAIRYVEKHRTIGDWYKLLVKAGFKVVDILEPPVRPHDGWRGSTFNNVPRNKVEKIPSTIIWKAKKP